MKPLPFLLLIGTLAISTTAQPKPALKVATAHRTIRDYYLLLPHEYFIGSARENLRSQAKVVDIAHDYIETGADGGQAALQTVLFRYRGAEVFAVNQFLFAIDAQSAANALKFYRLSHGKLRDVTSQVWPIALRAGDSVDLPRGGGAVVIQHETPKSGSKTRLKMLWREGHFIPAR